MSVFTRTQTNVVKNIDNVNISVEEYDEALTTAYELSLETTYDIHSMLNADSITESLILANESNNIELTTMSLTMLGLSNEEIDYVVSNEGIGSFIVKLYESIKLIFKKITNVIKKVVVKIVVAMNNVATKAEKLKKALASSGNETASKVLTEEESKNFNTFYTCIANARGKSKFDSSLVSGLLNFYRGDVPDRLKKALTMIDRYRKLLEMSKSPEDGFMRSLLKMISGETRELNKFDYDKPDTDSYSTVIINLSGSKAKALEVTASTDDTVKFTVISVSPENELDGSINVLDKSGINNLIDLVVKNAKNLKPFTDRRLSEIDSLYKDLDKLAENKSEGKTITKVLLKVKASVGTNSRALVGGLYLDVVLAYDKAIRKAYNYCKVNANYYNIKEL